MRNLLDHEVDLYRSRSPEVMSYFGSYGDGTCGYFVVPFKGARLHLIVGQGDGWEHISVRGPGRTPTWEEMDHVKRLFFRADEVVMQLHVAASDHINVHPDVLHLWRPQDEKIPLPPKEQV